MTNLEAYKKAINDIDDYFEYSNTSVRDRRVVHNILSKLTERLKDGDTK